MTLPLELTAALADAVLEFLMEAGVAKSVWRGGGLITTSQL